MRWDWDDATSARTVRIHTQADGTGGEAIEAWAGGLHASRVEIFAELADAVASHKEALDDSRDPSAPGDAEDSHHAHGDDGDDDPDLAHSDRQRDAKSQGSQLAHPGSTGRSGDGVAAAAAAVHKPGNGSALDSNRKAEDRLADVTEFERELAIGIPDEESGEDELRGDERGVGGSGSAGGNPAGRPANDASTSGQGPGGPKARVAGDGEGSPSRTDNKGTKFGTWAGDPNGSPDGMYGGDGIEGDKGIPSGIGLFGGLIPVPDALKGAVEVGIILENGDITGAGGNLFRVGVRKGLTIAATRQLIAREARIAAEREMRALVKELARQRAFTSLSKAERAQVQRILYWQKQRQFFRGYLEAAKADRRAVRQALTKAKPSERAALEGRDAAAATGQRVAQVEPVAGRLPRNHAYAGEEFPRSALPKRYQEKGLRFKDSGYPDFEPYARTLPNGKREVRIAYTGSRRADFAAANKAAGLDDMPRGWTWHHDEGDLGTMRLIPEDLHDAVKHTGGVAEYKHRHGIEYGN